MVNHATSVWGSARAIGWIILLAAIIRLGYGLMEPLDERDAIIYRAFGHHLVEGKGLTLDKPQPETRFPPLVPALLAGVYWLGGNEVVARELWATLGVLTVFVGFRLVRRRHGLRAANLAALGIALYPYHILMGGSTSTEIPNILLLTLGLLLLTRWQQSLGWHDAVLLGVCVGAAILNRPVMICLGLFCASIMIGGRSRPFARRWQGCGWLLLAATVVTVPWCIRTSLLAGQLSPPVTAGPAVIWEGNNPWLIAYMEGEMTSTEFRDHMLAVISDPTLTQAGKDRAFRAALRQFITTQPREALRLLAYKTRKFWQIPGLSTVATVASARRFKGPIILVGCLSYVPLLAVAIAGTIAAWARGRPAGLGWYLAWIAVAFATNILGASVTRYRFASGVDQCLIIIAAASLAAWIAAPPTASGSSPRPE